ncbi:PREDICTED: uncharacterized protein LOC108787928 [Nanorana parkeri]|uniref:uncharacterized protein LOC108787928 n=1 Tax=Nanorana parkeri TaxID=125878 RepID=UPI0008543312|nr:PREDICTED: uncharacterized protein LOC108787928 [Nanorana parkeri]
MAGSSASLPWLEKTRLQIQNQQEWKEFTEKLYDAVLQQMNENNIRFFNDLSESEKIFVLEKAAKALHSGVTYNKLTGHISSCLEENIYSYVALEQQDGSIPRSQSDLVASHIQDGLVSILEKRPTLKVKLHVLFNQPIPTALRVLAWKLQLSNTKARMEYLTQVSLNKTRSVLEREIALHCDDLLSNEQTLQHLKDNKNTGRCMRNVMSYYHKRSKVSLLKEDYPLLVPLVQVVLASSYPSTSLESMTTLLVEQYIAFMDSRPTIMCQNKKKEDGTNDNEAFQSIALSLEKIDPNLAHAVQNLYTSHAEDPEYALTLAMQRILQPVFQVFFVGYLNMNTLLYVWDQYILGLDEPSYNCLPALGLTFLLLLQSHLIRCSSPSEIEAALKMGGPALSIQEFQMVINKHFYQDLFNALNKGENSQIPVHDPTQATSHWNYISKVMTPLRTRPQDRRKAREERELLRRQAAEKEQIEEQIRRQHEEEQRRQEEERLNRLLEDARRRFEKERSDLENRLKQEQQQNYELEKRATKQINDLQSEIRRLLQQRRMSFGGHSIESVMAPPPSLSSQTPPQRRLTATPSSPGLDAGTRPAIKEVSGKTANTVVFDLLKHMMESADMFINGRTVAEKDTLNGITRKHQKNYKEDVKNAEVELFGRELELNELDYIEEPKRTKISKRLSQAIKRRTDARYTAAIKSGGQNLPKNVTYTDHI